MAKRELYKPAPSTLTGHVQSSPSLRSLAQGILSDQGSPSPWFEEVERFSNVSLEGAEQNVKSRRSLISKIQEEANFTTPEKQSNRQEHMFKTPENKISRKDVTTPDFSLHLNKAANDSQKRTSFTLKNEVVVVDASGPALNPELSEVSTTLHKVFSPAKVVCHSPSPEKSPQQGLTMEENIKVKIDSPKEIIFAIENTSKNGTVDTDSQHSENKSSLINEENQERITKKKKKAPRVIQSRYKNPKEPKPQKPAEVPVKATKPFINSFIHDISAIDSNPQGHNKGQMSKTKKAKVTSTPANPAIWSEKTRNYAPDGSYLDMSRNLTLGKQDVVHEIVRKQKVPAQKGKTSGTDSGIVMGTQCQPEHVSELQLDMEYCRKLQAMYINAKVKETFSKQEKEAKCQIYKVWQENQRLKGEVRNLEKAIRTKKHTMALDQLLKAQDSGLRAVDETLDQFQNNYFTVGEVLDSTRNYLPLEDIKVQDEDKLIAALKESQMLLAEISSYTGSARTDVQKLSTDLSVLVENLGSQISEQDRCQELLLAANSLTNQERSLQSQILLSDVK